MRFAITVVLLVAAIAASGAAQANDQATALYNYGKRIDAYMALRKKAEAQAPPLKETKDVARIKAAQQALANNIRAQRANAKAGDIFTPDVRSAFRRLMYPQLKGEDGADAKTVLKDDAPKPSEVKLAVNAPYTADSLPTVPSNLLLSLPTLPKALEYRIVNKDLILLDVDANIIVDFIPNAIQ
jgi:hypothetical protein